MACPNLEMCELDIFDKTACLEQVTPGNLVVSAIIFTRTNATLVPICQMETAPMASCQIQMSIRPTFSGLNRASPVIHPKPLFAE